ncbi:MAG: STAS domain-containing protein [Mariprofundus sp.]|nr:STAS domain-containing protein [Mariprofundus sp.]
MSEKKAVAASAPVGEAVEWIKAAVTVDATAPEATHVSDIVVLEGSLCIADAEAMHQRLSQVLAIHSTITIQAEMLTRVDAAGLQLLYTLVKELKEHGGKVIWKSVSDELKEAAVAIGLTEAIGFSA